MIVLEIVMMMVETMRYRHSLAFKFFRALKMLGRGRVFFG